MRSSTFSFRRTALTCAAVLGAAVACFEPGLAAALDVASCGQIVPARQTGRLVADLTCSEGVRLESGATLQLNGFTLTGSGASTSGCSLNECGGVWCRGNRCTIEGPGEIRDFPVGLFHQAPSGHTRGMVIARGLTLRHNGNALSAQNLKLEDATVTETVGNTMSANAMWLERVVVTGNGTGPYGFLVAIGAGRLVAKDTHVDANLGTGPAILTRSIRGERLTVVGNAGPGVDAHSAVRLIESTLTGNDTVDLTSIRRPRLIDSVCDRSSGGIAGDWDVCTDD